MISGYFMIDKPFSSKRLLKVLGEVWFYSIGFWAGWVSLKAIRGELVLGDILNQTVQSFSRLLRGSFGLSPPIRCCCFSHRF